MLQFVNKVGSRVAAAEAGGLGVGGAAFALAVVLVACPAPAAAFVAAVVLGVGGAAFVLVACPVPVVFVACPAPAAAFVAAVVLAGAAAALHMFLPRCLPVVGWCKHGKWYEAAYAEEAVVVLTYKACQQRSVPMK